MAEKATTPTTTSATSAPHGEGAPHAKMGTIVCYHHTETVQTPGTESPAIILAVRETPPDAVRLAVFGHGSVEYVEGALPGDEPGQWSALGVKPKAKAEA